MKGLNQMLVYQSYLSRPWGALRKELKTKYGYSEDELARLRDELVRMRKEQADLYARYKSLRKNWADFLEPLQIELRIARSQLFYWTPERSLAHHKFYTRYLAVLEFVRERIEASAKPRAAATPTRMPVKEPGPIVTAIRFMSWSARPLSASTSSGRCTKSPSPRVVPRDREQICGMHPQF